MKRLILLITLIGCTLNIMAQDDEPWRNNGHFEIGFSADAWNLHSDVLHRSKYFILKYLRIGCIITLYIFILL